ncbi:MAG: SUMF1/EgtB/PvdO family nonheme iron enzyme [Planctomycetes bacterium]|nr:SUMF1/EgtB/PvdO family nonheme iron enzyme [Planctomycetota bacterium]
MRATIRITAVALLFGLLAVSGQGQQVEKEPARVFDTPVGKFTDLGLNAQGYREVRRELDGATMVVVPGGWFTKQTYIGDPTAEARTYRLSVPAFLIDKYEVTNAQVAKYFAQAKDLRFEGDRVFTGKKLLARDQNWGLKIADGKLAERPGLEKYPSVGTTGDLALAFAKWVGGDLPYGYEWEKAAAGPSGLLFPWGDAPSDSTRANSFLHGPKHPMPVGSYPDGVSPYGLYDMAGNVYDRCYWYETDRQIDPNSVPRMIRGGSWVSPHWANLRTIDRCAQPMDAAEGSVGFRCVIRDAKVLEAIGEQSEAVLRIHDDVDQAFKEARTRNVPILLFLAYETCGQCDRTRAQVFTDPEFIKFINDNVVLLVGHNAGDGSADPVDPPEGASILYPGCRSEKLHDTFDYFCRTVNVRVVPKQISNFTVSPGMFALNPHLELQEEPDQLVLIGEDAFRKSGDDVTGLVDTMKNAQKQLGTGQTLEDFKAGKEQPKTAWRPPAEDD